MSRLGFVVVATVAIGLLAALTRWLLFRRSTGYRRALVPVAIAWMIGAPLGVWSESTDQTPPDWWRVVLSYTVPALIVGSVYWSKERRKQRIRRRSTFPSS